MKIIIRTLTFLSIFLLFTFCAAAQVMVSNTQTEASDKDKITGVSAAKNSETAAGKSKSDEPTDRERLLLERIEKLEKRLAALESQISGDKGSSAASNSSTAAVDSAQVKTLPKNETVKADVSRQISEDDRSVLDFFRDTTFNFSIDGYYGYNFNRPYNRLNLLRAYDTASNNFSLNQASIIIENAPNLEKNRRFGFRLDLQYGQATEFLQGSPNNEPRPDVYRPVWQAFGTYIVPVGKGLTVDFGKWAGSLGYETNYTKDNFNYSRSYFFNYLPYYHFGLRLKYPVNDKLAVMYHLINGTQQSEDFNNSKSHHIAFILTLTKRVTGQFNYYVGKEQRDQQTVSTPTGDERIIPRGRFHVFDAYATFLLSDKWTFAIEGDYVINRVNRNDPPSRVTGGAAYLRYQWTPKFALAGRGEYLSDRGGLFSGVTQALKEITLTGEYKFAEGFLFRGEYRRDWSNQPYFLTNDLNVLKKEQNTATLGFVWWLGRKQGTW